MEPLIAQIAGHGILGLVLALSLWVNLKQYQRAEKERAEHDAALRAVQEARAAEVKDVQEARSAEVKAVQEGRTADQKEFTEALVELNRAGTSATVANTTGQTAIVEGLTKVRDALDRNTDELRPRGGARPRG